MAAANGVEPRGGPVGDAALVLPADATKAPRVVRGRGAREGDAATVEYLIGLSWNFEV